MILRYIGEENGVLKPLQIYDVDITSQFNRICVRYANTVYQYVGMYELSKEWQRAYVQDDAPLQIAHKTVKCVDRDALLALFRPDEDEEKDEAQMLLYLIIERELRKIPVVEVDLEEWKTREEEARKDLY